jgi:putative NIF3 family GTP cyclohydrolase 1 type 2
MAALAQITTELESIAPLRLAADWDVVGLLVAPRRPSVDRVMTCLSLTPAVAAEAVRERADLVVAHHPLPFRPVERITGDTGTGRVLLELIHAGCGVWSSHTAWDSATGGINDQLAALLKLAHVSPIEPDTELTLAGFGRAGSAADGDTQWSLACWWMPEHGSPRRLAWRMDG